MKSQFLGVSIRMLVKLVGGGSVLVTWISYLELLLVNLVLIFLATRMHYKIISPMHHNTFPIFLFSGLVLVSSSASPSPKSHNKVNSNQITSLYHSCLSSFLASVPSSVLSFSKSLS